MDLGFTEQDGDRYSRHINRNNAPEPDDECVLGFGEMLDRIEIAIEADPALRGLFVSRFAHRLGEAKAATVSLDPFPTDLGTVELSIWDNQPNGKRVKLEGDTSRDKPARYALDIRACVSGHKTPLTTKTPDFRANVGDLFTADQMRARLKRAWKGMDPAEIDFLEESILPVAEGGYLVARLCYKRSGKLGGGTHFHPYHYALVSEQELMDRDVNGVVLITQDGAIKLPRCSTLDAKGNAFKTVEKQTKAGAKYSIVVGQSRATDLTSAGMKAWATGEVQRA